MTFKLINIFSDNGSVPIPFRSLHLSIRLPDAAWQHLYEHLCVHPSSHISDFIYISLLTHVSMDALHGVSCCH